MDQLLEKNAELKVTHEQLFEENKRLKQKKIEIEEITKVNNELIALGKPCEMSPEIYQQAIVLVKKIVDHLKK